MTSLDSVLMDGQQVSDGIENLSTQIHNAMTTHSGASSLSPCVIGIRRGGAYLARRLADRLSATLKTDVPLGLLDITLYRDDVLVGRTNALPTLLGTEIDFDIRGRPLILVDDVLFTGRTVRSALDALLDLGRPQRVWLAVLIDRGLRELPISADFVGGEVEAGPETHVYVELVESGHPEDRVVLKPAQGAAG